MLFHKTIFKKVEQRLTAQRVFQDLCDEHTFVSRRTNADCFRETRRLKDFDFAFNTSIKKDRVYDLATCRFVREHRDLLPVVPHRTTLPSRQFAS